MAAWARTSLRVGDLAIEAPAPLSRYAERARPRDVELPEVRRGFEGPRVTGDVTIATALESRQIWRGRCFSRTRRADADHDVDPWRAEPVGSPRPRCLAARAAPCASPAKTCRSRPGRRSVSATSTSGTGDSVFVQDPAQPLPSPDRFDSISGTYAFQAPSMSENSSINFRGDLTRDLRHGQAGHSGVETRVSIFRTARQPELPSASTPRSTPRTSSR